jgi:hypothetical protein
MRVHIYQQYADDVVGERVRDSRSGRVDWWKLASGGYDLDSAGSHVSSSECGGSHKRIDQRSSDAVERDI